ncbi:MAG: hypothetical protein ACTHMD_01645 [Flavisolibacter sp.]
MDKEKLLRTYTDIETNTFARADKTQKLKSFIAEVKAANLQLSMTDIADITNYLTQQNITIRQPFFLNVFYPVLTRAIDDNNVDAIKLLIRLFQYYGNYQNLTSDNKFTSWTLLIKGLQLAPNDIELLNLYEGKQRDYFEYTLHELPAGVLYGSDAATTEQCKELLDDLAKYEDVCKKLQLDRQELVDKCKFYYSAYKEYLTIYKNYHGFADFLKLYKEK